MQQMGTDAKTLRQTFCRERERDLKTHSFKQDVSIKSLLSEFRENPQKRRQKGWGIQKGQSTPEN